jgi:protein-S-isoprenylcysteine O-methyltransferase Ste14
MLIHDDVLFRLIVAVQFLAMGAVRAYFGAPGAKKSLKMGLAPRAESAWLTTILGLVAFLHFRTIFAYLANPTLLRWSAFEVGAPIRWLAVVLSSLGVLGEIWAAVSLGVSYSPTLRVSSERSLVTAGPYRWIRHPLYAFWMPVMTGWGLVARNWFILASGAILILILKIVRVPREEAMMVGGFGESYRQYITRTGDFVPRFRSLQKKEG